MNAPLRKVAVAVLVLFTLLIVNVNVIQVVRSDELRSDGRNTRVLAEEYDRERGSIVVAGNEVASSVPSPRSSPDATMARARTLASSTRRPSSSTCRAVSSRSAPWWA